MEKRYKVNRTVLLITFIVMVLLVLWVGYYVSRLITDADAYAWYKTVIAMVVLYLFMKCLKMPHTVIVTAENTLLFQSLFAKREVPIKDLIVIKNNFGGLTVSFKFKNKEISMINRIENLKELNNSVKRRKKAAKRAPQ